MKRNEIEKEFNAINSRLITALGMENKEVVKTVTAIEEVLKILPEGVLYLFDEDYFKRYNEAIDEMIKNSVEKEEGDN